MSVFCLFTKRGIISRANTVFFLGRGVPSRPLYFYFFIFLFLLNHMNTSYCCILERNRRSDEGGQILHNDYELSIKRLLLFLIRFYRIPPPLIRNRSPLVLIITFEQYNNVLLTLIPKQTNYIAESKN